MKRKDIFRLLSLMLTIALLLPAGFVHAAGADTSPAYLTSVPNWPEASEVSSDCAILMEAKTGSILYAKEDTQICHPASITKLMTALLVLENCSMDEIVTFSYRATHELEEGATSIARTEGEELTVEQCLYALLLMSANEVAQALAEHVSGSIEDFAVLMNERARELGCTDTNFTNPSGLNDDAHVTTCLDMAKIMRACISYSEFLDIESHTTYTIPATNKNPEELVIAQKHKLVKSGGDHYEGALAGKTGYTTIAGNTLVTYAVRGDLELICVVMKSASTHYDDTRTLLNYGFNNFSIVNISSAETFELTDSSGQTVDIPDGTWIPDDEWLVLPRSMDFAGLTTEVTFYADPVYIDLSGSESTSSGISDTAGTAGAGSLISGILNRISGNDGSGYAIGEIRYSYRGSELGNALLMAGKNTAVQESEDTTAGTEAAGNGISKDTSSEVSVTHVSLRERLSGFHPIQSLKENLEEKAEENTILGILLGALLHHPLPFLIVVVCLIGLITLIVHALRPRRRRYRSAYKLPKTGKRRGRRRR